jgi:hypothetical protein
MFVQSLEETPVLIELHEVKLLSGERDLGYFVQREVSVDARKSGWWAKCYGEVRFANGEEAHVLPGKEKDYVLGGLPFWSTLTFLATFHPGNAAETMSIRLVCEDGTSEWRDVGPPVHAVASTR